MLTPTMSFEIGNIPVLIWRAQPPACTRFGAMLNDDQNCGMLPTSVAGGLRKGCSLFASAGFCGPGSENAAAVALTAPCGGRSGLPNMPAARAAAVVAATPPAASTDRRENFDIVFSYLLRPAGFRAAVHLIGNGVTEARDNVH
jgi:hypothetical protein